jgi:glycerol 3-phosphatase-2
MDFGFDGLIVDLDGVVWIGAQPVPGSAVALAEVRARGVAVVFLTNNPGGSRAEYAAALRQIGVEATEEQIVTSGSALAVLIYGREGSGKTTYVIGSPSLKAELERVGCQLLDGESGRDAQVVAVGGHPGFTYDELRIASQAVRRGASFYGAGRDASFPMPDGPWPATGAILAAVETAAGTRAIVVGKPELFIFEIARSLLADCRRVAIVGDHIDSDIAGGKRAGLITILVLSGNTSREDLKDAAVQPDIVLEDLAGLVATAGRQGPALRSSRRSVTP